jgi:serine/threonine-protein kinase
MTTPKSLGKYQIETFLGKGAFAEVYKAVDTMLKRTVALKVLKPALLADEEAFARFVQEAQTLANLVHPHIAWVWDLGEAEGRYFIAMRYVDGKSLDKVIAERGALPWDETIKITEQVAAALQFAHEKGLVHRDVKPQNILVSGTEGAVLTDFGLVKALHSSGMSSTTSMIGTPAYIPPEIWEGEAAGPASDQYALACVMTEMLTGKVLFDGTTPATMKKHLLEPPPLPDKAPKGAPDSLLDCLQRALSKKPEERYKNVTEFVTGLKEPAKSPPKFTQAEVKQPARPRPKRSSQYRLPVVEESQAEVKRPNRQRSQTSIEGNELVLTLVPGMEMVFVRVLAGVFIMGSEDGFNDEKPLHNVHLEEYWMGKYQVTNAQYKAFVVAGRHSAPDHWEKGEIPDGKKNFPVKYVEWHDAIAFCKWASQASGETIRLPSEAEWEKAARGTDGHKYPWGNQKPDASLCNYDKIFGGTDPVEVHSPAGDSPYGCADMAGNVWEWTNSIYQPYPYQEDDGREDPASDGKRVFRGGSWSDGGSIVRSALRNRFSPYYKSDGIGFRCARSP